MLRDDIASQVDNWMRARAMISGAVLEIGCKREPNLGAGRFLSHPA